MAAMNNRASGALRPLKYVTTLLLALASSSAMALGLGDIRVLSKPGQPLLAEIPVISADPAELENLRVALASPVTFARVGLERPQGLVNELQFELTRNTQGRAVVRVSSATPVTTPSVNFLIEADWGQGRLVREYSALVDAPDSALAVAEPEIVAPAGAMSDAIVREPEPAVAAPAAQAPAVPAAPPRAVAATPAAPRVPATRAAPAAPTLNANGSVTVQRGQTLSQIAAGMAREQGGNRDQTMIALLRANPEAFIRGNVNLLKQGAVLRTPGSGELNQIDAAEAAAIVREHTAQWRQPRSAIPQPADSGVAAAPARAAGAAAVPAAAAQGARLEIAPAVAAADKNAGTTTGTAAGSEGDMLGNEQLRQAKEDVATRDAEIQDLRDRVAELEKLKAQQQSLIAMKDSDLAAAQQRLAQSPQPRDAGSGWYWVGLVVLLLMLAGWAFARRRKPSPLPPLARNGLDATALAAAVPAADYVDELAAQQEDPRDTAFEESAEAEAEAYAGLRRAPAFVLEPAPALDEARDADGYDPTDARIDADIDALDAQDDAEHRAERAPAAEIEPPAHALAAEADPAYRGVFEFPEDSAADSEPVDSEPVPADDAPTAVPGSPGRDRLELAIAYLDLGDADTARALLQEVAVGADPHSQAEARELLARLG